MSSSSPTSIQPSERSNKFVHIAFLVVSFLGFADAAYLTIKHYDGSELACGPSGGCNIVTTSAYSEIFGIPVSLLGALYYITVFFLAIAYADKKNPAILKGISYLTITGLLASLYFVSIQLFVLKTICYYCMVSAGTSTLLFITGMTHLYLQKKRTTVVVPEE